MKKLLALQMETAVFLGLIFLETEDFLGINVSIHTWLLAWCRCRFGWLGDQRKGGRKGGGGLVHVWVCVAYLGISTYDKQQIYCVLTVLLLPLQYCYCHYRH